MPKCTIFTKRVRKSCCHPPAKTRSRPSSSENKNSNIKSSTIPRTIFWTRPTSIPVSEFSLQYYLISLQAAGVNFTWWGNDNDSDDGTINASNTGSSDVETSSAALARRAKGTAYVFTGEDVDVLRKAEDAVRDRVRIFWFDCELPVLLGEGGVDRIVKVWERESEGGKGKGRRREFGEVVVWERGGCGNGKLEEVMEVRSKVVEAEKEEEITRGGWRKNLRRWQEIGKEKIEEGVYRMFRRSCF